MTISRLFRDNTAKHIREVRRAILQGDSMASEIHQMQDKPNWWLRAAFILAVLACMIWLLTSCSMAASVNIGMETIDHGINVNKYADAIYIIEGGKHTKHPYGVLAHYRHTTPRQACINTIKHQYRRWLKQGKPEPFTAFLGRVYAPVGCCNDVGTNQYWVNNLNYYLERGI